MFRGVGAGVLVAVLALVPVFASAQESEGLQIKPAVIEDKADPGQLYHFSINVTNIAPSEKTFVLHVRDIKGLDDNGLPVFSQDGGATGYELSSWVELPPGAVTLQAHESRQIPFAIRVPVSASPGAHFGGVFLEEQATKLDSSGAAIGISVGTIIDLKIAGDVIEDAQLREFSTDKLVYGEPSVTFNARVSNHGNVLVRPHGVIEVRGASGAKVGTLTVNDNAAPVFPGSDRSYAAQWNGEGFAFGRYQAVVSLVYGDDARKTISGTVSFWVLPLKPILAVVGALLGLVLVLYVGVRAYVRRTLIAMGAPAGRSDALVARRERALSRVAVLAIFFLIFVLVFLGLLFFLFA